MLLLNFIRLGEVASSLIIEALHLSGLNQTQAMICWQLEENTSSGLTLTELSLLLGIPQTRLQNHLPVLMKQGLIKLSSNPSVQDRRKKFYLLTALGTRKTRTFLAAVKKLDEQLKNALLPRRVKDQERWRLIRAQFIDAHLQLRPSRPLMRKQEIDHCADTD